MDKIITITGNVNYTITLDPGVWIFDDRRVDLLTYFSKKQETTESIEAYTKAVSKHWDREIMEGAIYPPTLKTEKKFEKEKVVNGTFGIPFKPFILNAAPKSDTETLVVHANEGNFDFPLSTAFEFILGFSDHGKPLLADGPIHIYFGDGSNFDSPIKYVTGFTLK